MGKRSRSLRPQPSEASTPAERLLLTARRSSDRADGGPNPDGPRRQNLPMSEESEYKTDLALARTVLAVERTFNAWIKTGIGFLAGGLGLAKLMAEELTQPHGQLILGASALLIAVAVTIAGYATHRYQLRMRAFQGNTLKHWPRQVILFIGTSFILVCVVSLVCLSML